MAKKENQLYEEMVFDDVQYAVDVVNAYKTKYNKVKRGLNLSIVSLLYFFLALPMVYTIIYPIPILGKPISEIAVLVGLILVFASYIIGGGLKPALRWARKLGTFGWLILPFPWDLFTGIFLMMAVVVFFFFCPVVFIYMNYRQINMDYKAAKKYLSYYKSKPAVQKRTSINQNRSQSTYERTQSSQTRTQAYSTQNRTYSDRTQPSSSRNSSSYRSSSPTYSSTRQSSLSKSYSSRDWR